jgi:diadenosine tetraphosphatase ApaH/serine/threonine PP2A family protein phosphatase
MDKQGVKKYISVGDIVGYGANPSECLAKVRSLGSVIVAGNHDQAIAGLLSPEFFNVYAKESVFWTQKNLAQEEIDFLRNLNLVEFVDNFTVTHATLYYPENFDYIQTSYDAHLSFDNQKTPLAFIGHSHIPVVFFKRRTVTYSQATDVKINSADRILVNVGAIGQPRDDNPDAVCAVYDSDEGVVRLKRTKYNISKAATKIKQAGLPEILAERLKFGR